MIIHLGCTLPYTSCNLPENMRADNPKLFSYLVLHRTGFTKLFQSPEKLVRSYRTVSPLPCCQLVDSKAVCSLLHFPSRHRDSTLWSVLSCGVRTFLQVETWRSFFVVKPILHPHDRGFYCIAGIKSTNPRAVLQYIAAVGYS